MIFGVWNFGTMPFGSSPAGNLLGIYAATQLTGVMHEQPAQMFGTFQGTQPNQGNQMYSANQVYQPNLPYPPATQPPPPFGCGKSAMIQLWELALQNNQPK